MSHFVQLVDYMNSGIMKEKEHQSKQQRRNKDVMEPSCI